MKREIKFRAWLKEEKKMGYPSHLKVGEPEGVFEITVPLKKALERLEKLYGTDEFDLMQFTGLKDKNGVEIYESDIIEFDTTINRRKVVEFDKGWFGIKMADTTYPIGNLDNIDIIGNIYENPELIK